MPQPPKFPDFGSRLKWWRLQRKFAKQGELARVVNISQPSLSELEKGHSKQPSAQVLLDLADALGLRPRYLLLGVEPAEGMDFSEISGLEAQLVMIYRQLPNDALRQAMLFDANQMLSRATPGEKAPAASPPPGLTADEEAIVKARRSKKTPASKSKGRGRKST